MEEKFWKGWVQNHDPYAFKTSITFSKLFYFLKKCKATKKATINTTTSIFCLSLLLFSDFKTPILLLYTHSHLASALEAQSARVQNRNTKESNDLKRKKKKQNPIYLWFFVPWPAK